MALGKQAKTLSKGQVDALLSLVARSRHPIRNRVIVLLSIRAGLRAKEIASLTWDMVTDSEGSIGTAIHLHDRASKGRSGRIIPMNSQLKSSLKELREDRSTAPPSLFVITTERSNKSSAQAVVNLYSRWYAELGFRGCSSHSGRRTFITNAARKISTIGGSLRDVQMLAGHSNLSTTQRYIEANGDAQRRLVELI
ncbi:MAG: tyrosine-type recombinase/integrase [Methylocystis sp.]